MMSIHQTILYFPNKNFDSSYDSVDRAILSNPHMFKGMSYSVEKCLSLLSANTPPLLTSGKFLRSFEKSQKKTIDIS